MPNNIFDHDKMYTYLKGYFEALEWNDALTALVFAKKAHAGQKRKSGEAYIIHPLTMACHAVALGIKNEVIVATCLLHDVCEDCGIKVEQLPVQNPRIKDAVRRMTHVKPTPLEVYYAELAEMPEAAMAKLFDRCDNVSTMAGVFKPEKLKSYIGETQNHVMPLWRKTKDQFPQYSSQLFVLKYHILSVIDGLDKCVNLEA